MKLFTKADDKKLFDQYSKGSDLDTQMVIVKIFNPYGNGTWFIMNSDPNDPDYLWGIVDLGYGAEVGSISRSDLETYRNRFRLGFERDISFKPINAQKLLQGLRTGEYFADGGRVYDGVVDYKKASKLLMQYKPEILYYSDGYVFVDGIGLSLGDLTNEFKGYGYSSDIKNLIYKVTHAPFDKAKSNIEKFTKGEYTLTKGGYGNQKHFLKNTKKMSDGGYFDGTIPSVSSYMSTYAEGGMMAKDDGVNVGYNVFNYTDNIYATNEVFKTKALANKFIKEFRSRFSNQGYYRDSRMNKINIQDIDLLTIPSDFNPLKKMANGGVIYKDLFEDYENQPEFLSEIVNVYQEKFEDGDYDYQDTANFLKEVESVGYTFEYGLDNEPYGLRPIGVELTKLEGYQDSTTNEYYADGGNVINAFQIRTIKGEGARPNEIMTTEQEVKFKKGGKVSEMSKYIPTIEVVKIHTKDGKVFENIYTETAVLSGIYVSDKPLRQKNTVEENQLELFDKGGMPKSSVYIPRYNIDFIETEYDGIIDGTKVFGGVWIDMKKQSRLIEEAKEKGMFNRKNEISKFEAIYNGKKISIDAKSLYEAKTKAISQLKVPKTKVGLLSVYNVKDPLALTYDNGGYFVNQPKEGDLITNYGKYGSRIIKVTDEFVYWFDSRMDKYLCKKNDLVLNNVDDDGDDDGFYQDHPNNWICQKKYNNGGALSDADRDTLIYVNQILRRAVLRDDLTPEEANSPLAFEIAKEEVEDFIDDDMEEMGSSDFGYMYKYFLESYKSVKGESFASGGGVDKLSFEEWMKQNNIEVYKRTYYWVADDGGKDYMYSGTKASVMKSLKEDYKLVKGESFAKGGSIKNDDIKVGEVFQLANGDVIEIVKLFIENTDEEWVEYLRNEERKENSVKELRLFINRLSGKKQKSFRERRNEYLYKLSQKEFDVWDKIGAESGSEIRNSDKMLKAYAEGVEEMLQKEGVGKGSFDQEDYDYFQDENSHLLNEFLVWNNYYEPQITKTEKAWREKNYAIPEYKNYVSNPKIIGLSSDTKSTNYVPKAKIKQIVLEKDGKEILLETKDVLNGVNLYEGGGNLKNDHVYFAKRFVKEVITTDGDKLKPSNGFWVKKSALKTKTEPKQKTNPKFKKIYKFEIGDIVWDKGNKTYGVVLNNYENSIDGGRGEIRLDSDGNQSIFKFDKNSKEIGYNLVPYGSKEDSGNKNLTSLKNSAKRVIEMTTDKENKDYYIKAYSKLLKSQVKNKSSKGGSTTKRGGAMVLAKEIRKDGESWQSALKRANEQIKTK